MDLDKLVLERRRTAEKEYQSFRTAFAEGVCYICKSELASFSKNKHCLHWLLRPKGFKKGKFPHLCRQYGMFRIQSYLRWVANQESRQRNINDLSDEGSGKLLEVTIRYQKLEWSISCSEGDFNGHAESKNPEARKPHYHFQMRIEKQPFINFNQTHAPLHEGDIAALDLMRKNPEGISWSFPFGEGMQRLFDSVSAEEIIEKSSFTQDPQESMFNIQSMIIADEGHTISGDQVADLIQEAKDNNKSIASVIDRIPNATKKTAIFPGEGVVEQAVRSERNRGGKK